ncbi:MAG: hypothetical protein ACKOA2_09865 [Ilumatobacteraceae bacterium]
MSPDQHRDNDLDNTLRRVAAHLSTRGDEYLERPIVAAVGARSGRRSAPWRVRVVIGVSGAAALLGSAVVVLGGGGAAGRLEPQTSNGGSVESSAQDDDTSPGTGEPAAEVTSRPDSTSTDGASSDDTSVGDPRLEPPVITVLPPPTVTSPGEQTSPVISEVDVPTVVTAGQTFFVRWRAADPDLISSTGVTIGWASGLYSACGIGTPGRLESGTLVDGNWVFTCTMPVNAVSTEYSVKVNAQDTFGNLSESGWFNFTVVGGNPDASPPTYSNVTVVSGAQLGAVLTVTWTLVDASGVESAVMWIAGPSGGFTDPAGNRYALYDTMVISSNCVGDTCSYTQTVQLSSTSPAGSYSLWVSATDTLGNKVLEEALSFAVVP